jgi:hypothetical protein
MKAPFLSKSIVRAMVPVRQARSATGTGGPARPREGCGEPPHRGLRSEGDQASHPLDARRASAPRAHLGRRKGRLMTNNPGKVTP